MCFECLIEIEVFPSSHLLLPEDAKEPNRMSEEKRNKTCMADREANNEGISLEKLLCIEKT